MHASRDCTIVPRMERPLNESLGWIQNFPLLFFFTARRTPGVMPRAGRVRVRLNYGYSLWTKNPVAVGPDRD